MRRFGLIILYYLVGQSHLSGASLLEQDSLNQHQSYNISTWYHHGFVLPHQLSIPYYTNEYINGFEIQGSRYFSEIDKKRPPEIGFGYYFSNMGNRDVYGLVHGFYMVIGSEYFRGRSPVYLKQNFSFGMSYNTEHFDIEDNPSNRLIGSQFNAFINLSIILMVELGENFNLSAGPSFTHMSNGNIKLPNFGLNLVNTRMGLTYNLKYSEESKAMESVEPIVFNKNRFVVLVSGGVRQISRKIPENFIIGSLLTEYSRRINPNHALGIGLDLIFDASEGREYYVTGARIENIVPWHGGIHLSWERIWNRLSILLQPGYKVITPSEHKTFQYNRLAVRYRIKNNVILNCAMKAHSIRADFIEFGVGYSFEK